MKNLLNAALWTALALGAQGAMATTMRCGDTLFDDTSLVPATKEQVLAACGEPTSRELGRWVYQQPGQFTRILQFEDGNLENINEQPAGD